MNSLTRSRASIRRLAAVLLIGATGPMFGQEQAPPATAEVQLTQRFAELQKELERLKTAGDDDAAKALAAELTRARNLYEGEFKLESTDVPELHAVGVHKGGTAPAGILKGNDRYTRGYAEVSVTHTAAPLILCASATERVHLQFKLAPEVRLAAVILGGRYTPTVGGLPPGTLLLNRAGDSPNPMGIAPLSWGDGAFHQAAQALREYSGKKLLSVISAERYAGKPLIVGPENKTWRAQYLLAQTEGAHRRASDAARAELLKRYANKRFRGRFYLSTGPYPHEGAGAEGEFTIAGPVMDTLRPMDKGIRHLVHDPNSGLVFGIDHGTQLIVVDPKADNYPKVPLANDFPGDLRLSTLAFDTKRNRFVLNQRDAPYGVYAYHLADATWKVLSQQGPNLATLTYLPKTDDFWGVTVSDMFTKPENKAASFYRLNADGEVTEQFEPPQYVTNTLGDFGGSTLAVLDGMLVVVTPPKSRSSSDAMGVYQSHIHVIDPQQKQVIYSGRAVPHDGKTLPETADVLPPPSGNGLLHKLFDRLQLADETVNKLRLQGDADRANELDGSIQKLRERLRGKWQDEANAKPRLHLVGIHDPKSTVVEVSPQPHPVILVLCSYNHATWIVRAAEGVKIERIIVGGYHKQTVKEAPAGVPVETYSHDERTNGFHTYKVNSDGHEQAFKRIRELTGLEPTTFQGAYQVRGGQVVIGDSNGVWLVQSVVAELDDLLRNAMNERHAQRRKELERQTFFSVYRTGAADGRGANPFAARQQQLQWGQFTIRGPMPQTLVDVTYQMEQIAYDPASGDWFARKGYDLYQIKAKSGEFVQIPWDGEVPQLSHPSAIAFDSSRQRLLLTSFGGGGHLYSYDVGEKKWSVVCRPGLSVGTMVYVPDEDAVYGLNTSHGSEGNVQSLRKFNAHGALLETYALPYLIGGGQRTGPFNEGVDLAYLNGRIVMIGPQVPDPLDSTSHVPQIHVFDIESKRFSYTGLLRPHPGIADLSAERLSEFWQLLADRNEGKADKAVWDMAAGHTPAVEYIASHLPPIPKVDEAEARKAIAELDSDEFETRKKATDKLALWGGQITPLLEAEAKNPSAEVRATVRRLLTAIEKNTPVSPELAREVRAMKVLEHIAMPEAVKLLERLAEGMPGAERTRAAKTALDRLARSSAGIANPAAP